MAFGLPFSKSPASDKTTFYDANSTIIDHAQDTKVDAAAVNDVGSKNSGTGAKNGSIFVEGTECPIVPTRNSLRSKPNPNGGSVQVSGSAKASGGTSEAGEKAVVNSETSKGKQPATTAANDMKDFTGIGNDPFFSVKAPPALTSPYTSSVVTPVKNGVADDATPRASSPKPLTDGKVADPAVSATVTGAAVGGATIQRRSTIKGTFADGAGTSGPNATPELDASQKKRKETAELGLDEDVVAKLGKSEGIFVYICWRDEFHIFWEIS